MGYSADFYKTDESGMLEFMFSVSGSDACQYFENCQTLDEVEKEFINRQKDYDTWTSRNWCNPWKTSKITDDVVVFEEIHRKWFEFWKPKKYLQVWLKTHKGEDIKGNETKMYFTTAEDRYNSFNQDCDNEEDFQFSTLKLFNLPIMK